MKGLHDGDLYVVVCVAKRADDPRQSKKTAILRKAPTRRAGWTQYGEATCSEIRAECATCARHTRPKNMARASLWSRTLFRLLVRLQSLTLVTTHMLRYTRA